MSVSLPMVLEPLTNEEKVACFSIARNFQDNPRKVYNLLKQTVGMHRVQLAIDFLKECTE